MGWAKKLPPGDREQIARSLFVVAGKESNCWLNGKCPLHEDDNPSFGYHIGDDVFHCHAACQKDGDLVDLFCLVKGFSQKEGFKAFRDLYGTGVVDTGRPARKNTKPAGGGEPVATGGAGKKEHKEKKEELPAVDLKQMRTAYDNFPEMPGSWIKRLSEIRGWSARTIKDLGIKMQSHYRCKHSGELRTVRAQYARIAIPIFDGDGVLQNIRLYNPELSENKIISWGRGVGKNRLFPYPDKLQDKSGLVWLCEGEADTIAARSQGLTAFTQTAKRKKWPEDQVREFKNCDVVIAYDADQPGVEYARAASASLLASAQSIRVIEWPDFMLVDGELPEKHGQDLTDFLVRHKKVRQDLEQLLPGARPVNDEEQSFLAEYAFFGTGVSGRYGYQPRLLAERLIKDVDLMFDPMAELLYRWNGQFWEHFDVAYLKRQAILYLGNESQKSRYGDAVDQVLFLSTMPTGRTVNGMAGWMCLKNGMFNVDTFELKPHDKDFYATFQLPVEFDPDNIQPCDRWQKFTEETIQTKECIEQLQEFFGYCLTRETRYEMCLIMIGDGGDGKSLTQKILRAMCGPENCTSVSFDGLEDQFQRVSLYNKMINLSSEVGGKAMDSEYFKKFVSGDSVTAAYKHKNSFEFEPFAKLIFSVNKMMKVLDTTDGLYRRILPIHYKRQFLPGDPSRDPHLEEKLHSEISGIFAWALTGLVRLRKRSTFNMNVPETQELLSNYRRLNSPVFGFVRDRCVVMKEEDKEYVGKTKMYQEYKSYCGTFGYGALHVEHFWQEMRREVKGLKISRPRGKNGARLRAVTGIALAQVAEVDEES